MGLMICDVKKVYGYMMNCSVKIVYGYAELLCKKSLSLMNCEKMARRLSNAKFAYCLKSKY